MASASIPEGLRINLDILTPEEAKLAQDLAQNGQQHLFDHWDPPGVNDEAKRNIIEKLHSMEKSMIGGIVGYIHRARKLLKDSDKNPFEGWRPEVPEGIYLQPFTTEYDQYEAAGLPLLGKVGFVLVAGGLGERLGYRGIKVELPVQTLTQTSYLEHYCQQILAMQQRYGSLDSSTGLVRQLPLAIMVSDDTAAKTQELLERHAHFGLQPGQVTLLRQGEVPALMSNEAQIALAAPYVVEAKPHGHGDVHGLLHSSGLAAQWVAQGLEYVVFFQDTNALGFVTLPAMLGVSAVLGLQVNSLAIPRVAKQAVGAITRLVREDGERSMTINVEYNQLDPLLRSTISPEGDVNDAATGHSPFPGNINQLVFELRPYTAVLEQTGGLMPEFVNPKYKDSSRTVFKKPTRLECMMQDFPKLLGKESKVGFTMASQWLCFSPVKNNSTDAALAVQNGVPAASPFTGESDQYAVFGKLLRLLGAHVEEAAPVTVLGVTATPSPRLVLHPSTALFPHELRQRFPSPQRLRISARSSLVLAGEVVVESLDLDGACEVRAEQGCQVTVRLPEGQRIVNAGHELRVLSDEELAQAREIDRMRGYV
ncbi:hypothetical protein EON64_15270, partial [archaeon]